jgi:hypothetical protein
MKNAGMANESVAQATGTVTMQICKLTRYS